MEYLEKIDTNHFNKKFDITSKTKHFIVAYFSRTSPWMQEI